MSTIYASTTATGNGDGSSWTNAMTNIQAALGALQNDGTLYTNAPRTNQAIGGFVISSHQNIKVITDQGPDGETWITNGRKLTGWTDQGGGVWSVTLAGTPTHVVYDHKEDTIAGDTTGVDLTESRFSKAIDRHGINVLDCRKWYGFLVNAGATTTPAEDEWGHTGGVLYVNIQGGTTAQDLNQLLEYCTGSPNGINFVSCKNFTVTGRLFTRLFPYHGGNNGYGIKGSNCRDSLIEGVIAIDCGWHSIGFPAQGSFAGDNCEIRNCIAIGVAGGNNDTDIKNPFVIAGNTDNASYNARFNSCHFIATTLTRRNGHPLYDDNCMGFITHIVGAGGTGVIGGVQINDCAMLSFRDLIRAKFSGQLTIPFNGGSGFSQASNLPSFDRNKPEEFPLQIADISIVGIVAPPPTGNVVRMHYDSTVGTVLTTNGSSNQRRDYEWLIGPVNYVGCSFDVHDVSSNNALFAQYSNSIKMFNNCTIQTRGTGYFIAGNNTLEQLVLRNNVWNHVGNPYRAIMRIFPTEWSTGSPARWKSIVSRGGNVFSSSFQNNMLGHSNNGITPLGFSEYFTHVVGASGNVGQLPDINEDLDIPNLIDGDFTPTASGNIGTRVSPLGTPYLELQPALNNRIFNRVVGSNQLGELVEDNEIDIKSQLNTISELISSNGTSATLTEFKNDSDFSKTLNNTPDNKPTVHADGTMEASGNPVTESGILTEFKADVQFAKVLNNTPDNKPVVDSSGNTNSNLTEILNQAVIEQQV